MSLTLDKKTLDLNTLDNDFKNKREFVIIVKDLIDNPTVKKMKYFRQHYNSSCYEHCLEVAYWSYLICKKLNLDYISVARARNSS